MRLITISREFGSGGKEFGSLLAKELGLSYYDREIITKVAEETQLDEDYIEAVTEKKKAAHLLLPFENYTGVDPYETIVLQAQRKVLLDIAAKDEDCVIIGRSAEVILQDYAPFMIFVYADIGARAARIRERDEEAAAMKEKELLKQIRKVDKVRAGYYGLVSGDDWGDKENYDLCINTTGKDLRKLVAPIAEYTRVWFEEA